MTTRLEKLNKIITEANDGLATYADVQNLIYSVKSVLGEFRGVIEQKVATNKAEMSKEVTTALEKLDKISTKLETDVKDTDSTFRSEIRTITRMFEQNVNDLEQRIKKQIPKKYEDSAIWQEFEKLRSEMPEMPDESEEIEEIETELEDHERRIEALEKRPAKGGGGGTSAAGVAHVFKYILKTETPVGNIDGINTEYTVSKPIFAILSLSLNGEVIAELPNYTISANKITFSSPLPSSYTGRDFECKYI